MRTIITALSLAVAVAGASRPAAAQPAEPLPDQPPEPPADQPADPWAAPEAPPPDEAEPLPPRQPEPLGGGFQRPVPRPQREIDLPVMFNAPTGHLLPAGVIMGTIGLDTGGGFSSDARIGLGDVAEFGFGTTDLVGVTECDTPDACGKVDAVQPYGLALFKMGISEDRLFVNQPALSLGFRKSFERNHDGRKTRVAELYLVGSKKLGSMTQIHLGGVFWDAGVRRLGAPDTEEVLLHDGGVSKQLRAFGGIEIEPLPRSKLMLEVLWTPEFRLSTVSSGPDEITLRPMFAWGVRYELAKWGIIESGVRIPDIEDINLLDAQIFGQFKLVSRRFSNFLDGLR